MQSIVVASDLSERSRPAVHRAVNLAIALDAQLTILNVVNNSVPDDLARQVQVGARAILAEQVTEDIGDRTLEYFIDVIVGDPIAEVGSTITKAKADLLIVGRHRRRTFLDQIRETTMEHFIRASDIPVLLVTKTGDTPYGNVLCGIDLSPVCTAALKVLPTVAPGADLVLFHAHEASFGKEARRDFDTWKTVHPVPRNLPDPVFVEAKARDALDDLMRQGSYDLLAIGGHTRATGGSYFIGKFTADLIRNPHCDLLIGK
ncbi:universal stress protein [uncultured Tateyamaria sp.]|uniref:universal stress protein n=1 Tax=uncultured Tateyamaria sp. TaxID=455651 RepID=UPI0026399039|nr:universal stress protein [uncultured Tateyamaria sp.]